VVGRLRSGVLAIGVLVALAALSGCDIPGLSSSGSKDAKQGDGKQLQLPEKTAYLQGQRVSPAPTPGVPLPSATSKTPTTPSSNVTTSRVPASPTCAGLVRLGVMNGLTVVPSSTSAAVRWQGVGADALEYKLAAIPQVLVYGEQPPVQWQSVPATAGDCGTVTATVTGLTPGTKYIFWLRAITADNVYGGTNDTWIARSLVITTG
jgi:hypothetical protein